MGSTRNGEWLVSELGVHGTIEAWEAAGSPPLLEEAREKVSWTLNNHQPPPLHEGAERELDRIEEQARKAMESASQIRPTDSEPEHPRPAWRDQSG
jgi:trimethylamine:corrinoid methyltransferase-like protein